MEILTLLLDIVRVLSGVANLASDYDCSNPCSFRDMTFFMILSEFEKNLNVKKFQNFKDLNPVIGICEGTLRRLRILPSNMTAKFRGILQI